MNLVRAEKCIHFLRSLKSLIYIYFLKGKVMAVNPNSLKNLEKGIKFYPGDPRIKRDGRTPGKRSLKNTFAAWLETETDCKDPAGNDVQLPLVDKVILALINKASKGDVSAANVVLGNAYGIDDTYR